MTEEALPPGAERRRFKRRSVQFPVRYRLRLEGVITEWHESEAGNVSAGGLFVTLGVPPQQGQVLELEFILPATNKPIRAKARIAWLREKVAGTMVECGLEFMDIAQDDRDFLDHFANEGGSLI